VIVFAGYLLQVPQLIRAIVAIRVRLYPKHLQAMAQPVVQGYPCKFNLASQPASQTVCHVDMNMGRAQGMTKQQRDDPLGIVGKYGHLQVMIILQDHTTSDGFQTVKVSFCFLFCRLCAMCMRACF
jgi:hypothetical protein